MERVGALSTMSLKPRHPKPYQVGTRASSCTYFEHHTPNKYIERGGRGERMGDGGEGGGQSGRGRGDERESGGEGVSALYVPSTL